MTGSIKWYVYTADDNTEFAGKMDEGWLEAVVSAAGASAGTADYTTTSTAVYSIPRNLKERHVLLSSIDGKKKARVVVPTQAMLNAIDNTGTFSVNDPANGGNIDMRVTLKVGERTAIPRPDDTRIQDGDAT